MTATTKTVAVVLLCLVVLVVVTLATGRTGDTSRTPRGPSPDVRAPVATDPVAAAAGFLAELRPDVLLDPVRREAVLELWGEPDALPELRRTYSLEAERVRSTYQGAPLVSRSALLGYQLHRPSATECDVAIWAMAIAAGVHGVPATGWGTVTVRLHERAGAWRVVSVKSGAGPSPDETGTELAQGAAAFHSFSHAR